MVWGTRTTLIYFYIYFPEREVLFVITGPPLLSMASHCLPRATTLRGRECRTAGLPAARNQQEGRTRKKGRRGSAGINSRLPQEIQVVLHRLYLIGRLGDERTYFFKRLVGQE